METKYLARQIVATGLAGLLTLSTTFGANSVIGFVSDQAGVTIDGAPASGGASLFAGSTVRAEVYSRIHLQNGATLDLGKSSSAKVYGDHILLEAGTITVKAAKDIPVNVMNSGGVLVARVSPAVPMSFFMFQGASASKPETIDETGCVLQKGNVPVIVDDSGTQVAELRGTKFNNEIIGKRARVVGVVDNAASPSGGAQRVIDYGGIKAVKDKGSCSDVATKIGATAIAGTGLAVATAGAAGASAGAAAAAAAGIGTTVVATTAVSTGLIVGGVAAVAGGGAIAAVVASKKSSQ